MPKQSMQRGGARSGAGAPRRGRKRSNPPRLVDDGKVRLNKFLAEHGLASRRRCDEMIESGAVFVDGAPETRLGTRIDPTRQTVEVDGVVLKPEDVRHRYYLLSKPAGVVCTNDERELRRRAVDLIRDPKAGRLFTVGRLDEDTVGLILCTNDGEFANRVMHPRYGVPKTYRVRVHGRISDEALNDIRDGVYLAEGRTAGARVLVQKRSERFSTLVVTLQEGKNREVRRMFAKVGAKVASLIRTRIGPITDRGLKPGHWRPLTREEVGALLAVSRGEEVAPILRKKRMRRPRRAPKLRPPGAPG